MCSFLAMSWYWYTVVRPPLEVVEASAIFTTRRFQRTV